MKEQIFISYKRVDKERVFAIKDFIEQNTGAKCWIDLEGIESNAQFADKIGTAIDNCQVFIFMRSNAHNTITDLAKDWTYREVNYALEDDKNIIVINLDQSPMPKWFKMLFPNKQEIDATNSDMLNRLCDDLCSWLGILKPAAEPDSESQKKAKQNALPKEGFQVDNLTYKASGNGGVSVCGCDKSLKEVHIPAKVEYGGYTYDVDRIGYRAFWGCSVLTSIIIPNSVTSIVDNAFYACSGLTSISIPDSVTSIGCEAFSGCESLTSISIPNSVISIGPYAFSCCESLTTISIPNSVTSIGYRAFLGCSGLTSIIVEKGNKKYDSRENCNAIIETATNTLIRGCDNTIFPNSVTSIECEAFKGCSSLSSITIPDSVTSIGDSAFSDCSSLSSIIVEKGNKKYDSRENCNAIIETASNTLISGCKNTIIPNSVTSIGDSAFWGCSSLTSITIPNSVISIEDKAFFGCESLTSITIPNSVISIGDSAFYECERLTSITIPNSVISIGEYAFYGCKSLTSITIPNSVISIGEYAFYGCKSLTSITIPNSVTSIGERAFGECSSLREISIPKKLTNIVEDAIPEHTRVRKRGSFWPF